MKQGNDTKQKLLHITRRMIDENGIDSVSMRDLGKKMNLSRSAIYRHFKNKEDLLAALMVENFNMLKNNISDFIEEIDDPKRLITQILQMYYDFGKNNRDHYQLMFQKQWDKEEFPNIYMLASDSFSLVENYFEQELEARIRNSPMETTAMILSFIHGLVDLHISGHLEEEKGLDNSSRLIQSFVNLIFV